MKNDATNSSIMKYGNRRLVLNIIRKKPVSRAGIARITGLTRAAVTIIVEEMLNEGLLIESGTGEAEFGRKPILLDINPNCFYAIGLSVTRHGCFTGIIDIKGNLLIKQKIDYDTRSEAGECLGLIIDSIGQILDKSKLSANKLLGIGISTPGPVDIHSGTILNPPNFEVWNNMNMVREIKKSFDSNIYIENNSTALALAENYFGRGPEFNSFMLLVVDSGIGAGIIINDQIYRGVGGFGSEVGHTTIDMNGKTCSCGNKGCLEVYASMPSILDQLRRHGYDKTSWSSVVEGTLSGNTICNEIMDMEARYLSAGIVNAMNILELEAVILTGDINYKPQMLIGQMRKYIENTAITRNIHNYQIVSSSISENVEIISASSIIIEKYFKGEI
jgi:Transcriptional regulator/sugar kinase